MIACTCGAKLKSPDAAAGKTFKCPVCGRPVALPARQQVQPLPVDLADPAPVAILAPAPAPMPVAVPAPMYKSCPYCAETILAAARVCKHCGRDLDTSLTRPRSSGPVVSNVQPAGDYAHSLGIASVVLGIVGLVIAFIPCVGFIGMPLSGLGLLLGIVGLLAACTRSGRGIGFSIAGCAICGLALLIGGFWLETLSKAAKKLSETSEDRDRDRDRKTAPASGGDSPARSSWSDAGSKGSVGDVSFESPWARPVEVLGLSLGQGANFGKMLVVKLKLTNTSSTRIVTFGGWQREGTLEDEHGNKYSAARFGAGFDGFLSEDQFDRTAADKEYSKDCDTHAMIAVNLSLHPGKSYITYLFYETPAAVSKEARLTLPAKVLGDKGEVRLRVSIETEAEVTQKEREEAAAIAKAKREKEEADRQKAEADRQKEEAAARDRQKRAMTLTTEAGRC